MTETRITHLKIARYPELLEGPFRPIHWDVDPSTACDHACRGCPYIFDGPIDPMLGIIRPEMAKDRRTLLDFDVFLSFLEQAIGRGCKAITFVGGGEPTLHPRFTEMMEACTRRGVKFGVITHLGRKYKPGFFEALKHATWVRVSVNAGTRETYLKHQGKDHLIQVLENTINGALNYGCRIGWSFLITPDNWKEIASAASLARDAHASYIQYKPLIEVGSLWCRDTQLELRIEAALQQAVLKNTGHAFQVLNQWSGRRTELQQHAAHEFSGKCHVARFNPKLGANGIVYQCCELAYSDEGAIGSIYEETLDAILAKAEKKVIDQAGCPHCWAKPVNQAINAGEFASIEAPPESVDQEFV